MAINLGTYILYEGEYYLDSRQGFATEINDLVTWNVVIPDGFEVYIKSIQKWYTYDSKNNNDPITGKFRERVDLETFEILQNQFELIKSEVEHLDSKLESEKIIQDTRYNVLIANTTLDLISVDNWERNGISYVRQGTIVSVIDDINNNGVYWLKSLPYTILTNWEKIGASETSNIEVGAVNYANGTTKNYVQVNNFSDLATSINFTDLKGKSIMISAYLKGENAISNDIYVQTLFTYSDGTTKYYNTQSVKSLNGEQHFICSAKLEDLDIVAGRIYVVFLNGSGKLYSCKTQIEIGNVVTDWRNSENDILQLIENSKETYQKESIYTTTKDLVTPETPLEVGGVWKSDYIDAQPTKDMPYSWISSRTKIDDTWSTYSIPAIFTSLGEEGAPGEGGYSLYVLSSNGLQFLDNNISTTLTAVLFQADKEITDEISPAAFIWTRVSDDPDSDSAWNELHVGVGKSIEIDTSDVLRKATFNVEILNF